MTLNIFEPEETIGKLWDRLISRPTDLPRWPEAAVAFADMQARLGVFFRTLGGDPGIDLKATTRVTTTTRLGLFHRLGHETWQVPRARIDGDTLLLPDVLDVLPAQDLNRDLYYWLTAWAAAVQGEWPKPMHDPLQADIEALRFARRIVQRTLAIAPGLKARHTRLCEAALRVRPARRLPPAEEAVETAIRWLLQEGAQGTPAEVPSDNPVLAAVLDEDAPLVDLVAPPKYRTFLPVPLWGDALPRPERTRSPEREDAGGGGSSQDEEEQDRKYRGRRRRADEAEKKDPLILNRFEHILALAEFFNLNRLVDDEDSEENARKARDDLDEIALVDVRKKPKTRLRFDLDLSPEDIEAERLAAEHVYPEWDYRRRDYLPGHCRVLVRTAEEADPEGIGARKPWQPDEATRRRIRAVRRQFEALRPRREILRRQMDGTDFDTDALVRSITDLAAHGEGSDRIYLQAREVSRDLAVAVLFDTSRSTESWVEGRQVIDIAREALTALTEGLAACGDDYAIYAFSSIRRKRVYVNVIKGFDEPRSAAVHRRIAALRPGFYTRLGAAIRHVTQALKARSHSRRLLLVITDGKPNDLDHYEGRYGVEDTARAIMEARREGLRVFGVTIDSKAQAYFPYIFGRNAYAIVSRPARLTAALPRLYRHLVT